MWIILMKNYSTEAKQTSSNMKTRRAFILLLIFAIQLSIYAENILRNPLMSDKAANGLPVSWNVRNGTWRAVEGGFSLGAGAVACIVLVSMGCCFLQFFLGRRMEGLTAGQALGQKNTGFLIWLGYNYMTPVTSVAGGLYAIWQNLFNSWELYRKEHR